LLWGGQSKAVLTGQEEQSLIAFGFLAWLSIHGALGRLSGVHWHNIGAAAWAVLA
tara:strand:+ start:1646 stop:1810 length:165 start_codon:yes stop_codon:yes gene_type:complete